MSKKRIAVLGANGRLGRVAARAFAEAGWRVRAINRTGRGDISDVEYKAANAMEEKEIVAATRDCDFIFNGLNPKYDEWRKYVLPLARNVVAAAKASGAVHLFPGNVYNFGTAIPEHPTETTAFVGDHRKAAIRIEAEALFERAARQDGVKTVILRAGDFFGGDGRGSWFDLIVASKVKQGKAVLPGPQGTIHAWAYLPDLARAFVAIGEHGDELPDFARFHFEGHNVTLEQMHAALEKAMGRSLAKARFPWLALRLGSPFVPIWREVLAMTYLWKRPHRLTGEKLHEVVGQLPQTPLDRAVAEALADLGIPASLAATGHPAHTPALAA